MLSIWSHHWLFPKAVQFAKHLADCGLEQPKLFRLIIKFEVVFVGSGGNPSFRLSNVDV